MFVFSKFDYCEREDIHACSTPGADKTGCLQVYLRLPSFVKMQCGSAAIVTALLCTGPNYTFSHIWAGDSVGQLTIWSNPDEGLTFTACQTAKAHGSAIRAISSTWKHAITIGDDGVILLMDLNRLTRIRTINFMEWALHKQLIGNANIPRRLKALHIVEDAINGGSMVIGTSYGEIAVFPLGAYV